jgi:hypothetical protein
MNIDVSTGELVDRVTILSIKIKKIKNKKKLENVRKQYECLKTLMEAIGITIDAGEFIELEEINLKLWDAEDAIRLKEKKKEFDEDFIQLARSIYLQNDNRDTLKRNINLKYGSELTEEKEYVD